MALRINSFPLSSALPKIELRAANSRSLSLSVNSQMVIQMRKESGGRKIWRRRTLIKKDRSLPYKMERVPFMEEHLRKVKEDGKLIHFDVERLMISEENRYDFVNEIAAEATAFVDNNKDEYGGEKKAILHALSDRVNDTGVYRPDAYAEPDPFKPGPHYLKEFFT